MKHYYLLLLYYLVLSNYMHSQIAFEDQSAALGVDVTLGDTFLGNGVSFYDFDDDGWDDLTITSSENDAVRFFKNNNGTFDEQFYPGLSFNYETKSVTWIDYDNDGDNDFFVTSAIVGNKLMENTGNMTFIDVTSISGITPTNLTTYGASWGDFDNDGFLDLFISNRTDTVSNLLYKNNGNGTFTDVSLQAGIDTNPLLSFCSAFLDINNDGYQDIYVINDKTDGENKLYKNNSDGTFTDISEDSGTNISIDAMSATVGDYNSDGFFDIYVTNNPSGNYLLRNNGDETFTNIAEDTGTEFNSFGWGAAFFDADNDMDLDLYVSGQFDGSIPQLLSAAFYENNNDDTFTLNNSYFPGDDKSSYSNAIGDINNDGLVDLVVVNNDDSLFLWKNVSTNPLNWIKIKLTATLSNKNAVGARIEISTNGQEQYRYTFCGQGYLAQYGKNVHFGVGANTEIDYVKIYWPSGIVNTFFNVSANQTIHITEGDNTLNNDVSNTNKSVSYPNPVKDVLYIKSVRIANEITVRNILSQEIIKTSPNSQENAIDIRGLSQGTYFAQLLFEDGYETLKIIKK